MIFIKGTSHHVEYFESTDPIDFLFLQEKVIGFHGELNDGCIMLTYPSKMIRLFNENAIIFQPNSFFQSKPFFSKRNHCFLNDMLDFSKQNLYFL